MASSLAQLLAQGGLDPRLYGQLQNVETGNDLLKQGLDASPTSGWGALGRLAQTLAGTYLTNSSTSDLAKTIAGGRKSAADDLLAAVGGAQKAAAPATTAPEATSPSSYGKAISGIESGGNYGELGPVTKTGDRAYGKYQVMGANIPEWTQTTLGKSMTPAEFLANPDAQEAVFNAKFGEYAKKYGPEGAAKAWFAGEKGMNNPNARDAAGTTVQGYANKFTTAMGGQPPSAVEAIDDVASGKPAAASPAPSSAAPAQAERDIDAHRLMAVLQNPYADEGTKQLAQKLLLQKLSPPDVEYGVINEDAFGNKTRGFIDKTNQTANGRGIDEKGGGSTAQGSVFDNIDANKVGEDYLKQFPAETQTQVRDYLEGRRTPTGNPRKTDFIKQIASKYGNDIGMPADDASFAARRKMLTDLSASSNNSMGGILSNGKSSFDHLATLSDKMVDLGNYNGPSVPGGGHIAAAGNIIGNSLLPTSETKGKITAFNDNALKYGQEATKFYAGSGGGEAERMNALHTLNPSSSSGEEQAGFLSTEKELTLARLSEKEKQIRDTLGQGYLDKHPVMTPDLQKQISKIDANIEKLRGTAASAGSSAAKPAEATPSAAGPDRAAIEAEMKKRGLLK